VQSRPPSRGNVAYEKDTLAPCSWPSKRPVLPGGWGKVIDLEYAGCPRLGHGWNLTTSQIATTSLPSPPAGRWGLSGGWRAGCCFGREAAVWHGKQHLRGAILRGQRIPYRVGIPPVSAPARPGRQDLSVARKASRRSLGGIASSRIAHPSGGLDALSPAKCRRRAYRVGRSGAGATRVSRWARPSSR
jgi:hypothetical protein